ncbi:hypothetical protein [Maliponia aquimaris]|nr:hypothetical protein [Maliponia aquimaris]
MTERKDNRNGLFAPFGGDEAALDGFFAAARATTPQPGGDFLARMEALALAEQPAARPTTGPVTPRRAGLVRQLREALGGWIGMAGLAAACAAGIWIGVSPPDSLSDYWGVDAAGLGTLGVDPLGGFDLSLLEG